MNKFVAQLREAYRKLGEHPRAVLDALVDNTFAQAPAPAMNVAVDDAEYNVGSLGVSLALG